MLLDVDKAFPAAPFDSEEALAALTRLGMRGTIGPDSILQSAWYIAELGLRDPDQAHDRCLKPEFRFPSLPPRTTVVHTHTNT